MAYIDKDLLLKDIRESVVFSVRSGFISPEMRGARKVIDRIETIPTADVVEVVRCKDCKHGHWNQETCHGKPVFYCDRTDLQVSKYSFCSYGERKE